MSEPRCKTCRYCQSLQGNNHGVCHRYPETVSVSHKHWCGEHQPRERDPMAVDQR